MHTASANQARTRWTGEQNPPQGLERMDLKSSPPQSQRPHEHGRRSTAGAIIEQPLRLTADRDTVGPIPKACAGMRYWIVAFRVLSVLGLALWVGGFSFYSTVVIPALHEAIGSVETGYITRGVTNTLNAIGTAALVTCWLSWALDSRSIRRRGIDGRLVLLVASSAILATLVVLHRKMDQQLESTGLAGFYSLHRLYLIASTAHWFVNVGLLTLCCLDRAGRSRTGGTAT